MLEERESRDSRAAMPINRMAGVSNENVLQNFDAISSISEDATSFRRDAFSFQRRTNLTQPEKRMSDKNFRIISIVLLAVGLAVLIAGAVMLGVGISKYNDSKKSDDNGATVTTTVATTVSTTSNPAIATLLKAKALDLVFLYDQTAATINNMDQIRQFLSDYVSNFNIGPQATQVAVVGTSSSPTGFQYIGFKDASNLQDLQTKIKTIPAGNSTDNGSPNLHKACEYIMQHTFHPVEGGRRIDVPVVIVALIFSQQLDPVYYNTATAVWRATELFGITLTTYPTVTDTLIKFTRSADTVAQVTSIGDLTDRNNAAIQKMSAAILNSTPQRPVPLNSVRSDIVVILDVSNAMISDAFSNTMKWLRNFPSYFTISPQYTQISVLLFDNTARTGSFFLSNASDVATLVNKIDSLQWPNSNVPTFDLQGAVQYTTNTILTLQQGWRQQHTYVLVVAINNNTATSCADIRSKGTVNLAAKADIYGMALTGVLLVESYLYCVIPPFPQLHFAKAVPYSFLIPSGLTDTVYDNEVSRSYQRWVERQSFSTPIPMNLLQMDIVFLIDQSMFLSQTAFNRLQNLIYDFASIGALNIGPTATQLSVISYDTSVFGGGSFTLTSAIDLNSLLNNIRGLKWNSASSAVTFDISGAFDYLISTTLTTAQGHQSNRSVATVVFASAPTPTAPLNSNRINQLIQMGGIFCVDIANIGAAPNYLLQATNSADLNILRWRNTVLNPNGDIESMQRINGFVSNVANSWRS